MIKSIKSAKSSLSKMLGRLVNNRSMQAPLTCFVLLVGTCTVWCKSLPVDQQLAHTSHSLKWGSMLLATRSVGISRNHFHQQSPTASVVQSTSSATPHSSATKPQEQSQAASSTAQSNSGQVSEMSNMVGIVDKMQSGENNSTIRTQKVRQAGTSDFDSSASYVSETRTSPARVRSPRPSAQKASTNDMDDSYDEPKGSRVEQHTNRRASSNYNEDNGDESTGDQDDEASNTGKELDGQSYAPEPAAVSASSARGASRRPKGPIQDTANGPAEYDEATVRREQEAAEASEAELADRSALDEQQAQQREIILAQAQSEAKAIKDQQAALLKQQALQQQMIMRRHHEIEANQSGSSGYNNRNTNNNVRAGGRRKQARSDEVEEVERPRPRALPSNQRKRTQSHLDREFSDHADNNEADLRFANTDVMNQVVVHPNSHDSQAMQSAESETILSISPMANVTSVADIIEQVQSKPEAESKPSAQQQTDLTSAAQHSYGAHFAPLHGHQKDFYQFAESFKKGQFHSGYKRGGKKMQISGHASQHGSHAEGHVKWNGYKGKGTSYWNYQHSGGKKHHGHHY